MQLRYALGAIAFGLGLGSAALAFAAATVGQPAPDFAVADTAGKPVKLSELKGKTIVLEWTNHQCPFVGKHYDSGNMQKLQKEATAKGVVWLTLVSSAAGEEGHVSPSQGEEIYRKWGAGFSHLLLDPEGKVGRAYGARATPHMYVVAPDGRLAYMGAIDDKPSTRQGDIAGARNHVRAALEEVAAGRPVAMPATQAYGCSVKYKG